jgi:hypothetical protein
MDDLQARLQREEEIRRQNAALFTRDEGAWFTGVPGTDPVDSSWIFWTYFSIFAALVLMGILTALYDGIPEFLRIWGRYSPWLPSGTVPVVLALIVRRKRLTAGSYGVVAAIMAFSFLVNMATMSLAPLVCPILAFVVLIKIFFFPGRKRAKTV